MENLVETYQIVYGRFIYSFVGQRNTFHFPFVTFLIDILQDRTVIAYLFLFHLDYIARYKLFHLRSV